MGFLETIRNLFFVTYLPWSYMDGPVAAALNETPDKSKELLAVWRKAKLAELNFVGLTGALIAATGAATFSWPTYANFPWTAKAFFYASLVFALMAVSIATQQGVSLTRVSSHIDVDTKIRGLLGKKSTTSNAGGEAGRTEWTAKGWQGFVWQIPTMLLGWSIIFFLVGLTVFVSVTARGKGWEGDGKVALCFAITVTFATFSYMVSWYNVEFQLQTAK